MKKKKTRKVVVKTGNILKGWDYINFVVRLEEKRDAYKHIFNSLAPYLSSDVGVARQEIPSVGLTGKVSQAVLREVVAEMQEMIDKVEKLLSRQKDRPASEVAALPIGIIPFHTKKETEENKIQ